MNTKAWILFLTTTMAASAARAETAQDEPNFCPVPQGVFAAVDATIATYDAASFDVASSAISDEELNGYRGAASPTSILAAIQSAQLENNVLNGSVTGSNIIASGAMSNTNGIAVLIQNSGNFVSVQNSTQLNVTFNQ